MGVTTTREEFTPDMCKAALAKAGPNRPISHGHVERLRLSMRNKEMHAEVAAQIVFSDQDLLIGGQHRLTAQLLEGLTITWTVVRGVRLELAEYIDQDAKPQRRAHVLQKRGVQNSSARASIVREMMIGDPRANGRSTFSLGESDSYEYENRDEVEFALSLYHLRRKGFDTPFWAAVGLCRTWGESTVVKFVHDVISLENLEPGTPAHTFARWIASRKSTGGFEARRDLFTRTMKAIEAHARGIRMDRIHGYRHAKKRGKEV